ncbi:LuxR C-terminal-related transcriptional regulator [Leifsonia shinshuensis]
MTDLRPAAAPLAGRERTLALVRELLFSGGADVDVVGAPLSGRSSVADAVAASAADAHRTVLRVGGVRGLRATPLAALHAAGFGVSAAPERRGASPLQLAIDALTGAVGAGPATIVADDADLLDDASLGAIDAVRRVTAASVLRTRSRLDPDASAPYVVELAPLDYEELRSVVTERLGSPVDATAMSRVFALTGGNVGLALALTDVAVLEGRLVLRAGAWCAAKALWSPALRGVVAARLADLTPSERAALATIASAGVGDVSSARGLVEPAAIDGLRAAGVLRVLPHGDRRIIVLDPPLLAESFREEAGRRHEEAAASTRVPDPVFAQLVHAAAEARHEAAGARWKHERSGGAALALAQALLARLGTDPGAADELDDLLAVSAGLRDDPVAAAELAVLHARRSLAAGGGLAEAVAALRDRGTELGPHARIADAAAVLLAVELGAAPVGGDGPRDDPDLPHPVRARLLEACQAQALRSGRFVDAAGHFHELRRLPGAPVPASAEAAHAYALLGAGRHAEAVAWAARGAAAAHDRLDAGALRAHSVALGLCHLLADDDAAAAEALATASTLGSPAIPGAAVQVGLGVLGAVAAVRRGDTARAERIRDELAAARAARPDAAAPSAAEPTPAARWGVRWIDAQLTAGRGRPDEAAGMLRELATDLTASGELALAALALLTALEQAPDAEGVDEAHRLLARQQSELHDAHLAFLLARAAPDRAQLPAVAARLAASGRTRHAVALDTSGRPGTTESPATTEGGFFSTPIALTEREREIVRLVAGGLSNPQIAARLVLSVRTVESHVSRVMRKTSAGSRGELAAVAGRLAS